MIKEQQSVDETIERFRRDRQMIKDRMNERNLLFSKATQNYQQSVQREIETIKKTQNIAASRNQEFRAQINNLYKRYEGGSERLRLAIQKTNIEKINYNNYLIKVYPHNYTSERQKLIEENQRLKELLQGIRPNINEDPIYIQDRDQQEDFEDFKDQLDHYIQPNQEQQQQQYQQQQQFNNSIHTHQPSNSQGIDHLDQFLLPQNINNKL